MAYSENHYLTQAKAHYNPWLDEQLNIINQSAAKQNAALNTIYESQKTEKDGEFADLERQNAVQKLINERDVAENMANLGLTDSGLNRTQQTAVQLSAANNSAKIQRQKQSYYDTLTRELTAKLADIETSRLSSEAQLRLDYNDKVASLASTWRQADIDAETKRQEAYYKWLEEQSKAAAEAEGNKLLYTFQGESSDKLGYMSFVDNNGKVRTFAAGINPYTGENNLKTYSTEAKDPNIGFFSNGYQPKGLVSEGGKFSKATDKNGNVLQTNITGKLQTVWKAPNGKYFVWYGDLNQYREVQM